MAPIPHDLSTLLTALRAEGIPIGPGELTRLAHAFRQGPVLDRRNLRELLACTLIKGADRSGFDTLFDAWYSEDKAPGPPAADEDGPETRSTTPDPADQARPPAGEKGMRDMPFAPEPEPTIPETPETDSGTRRRILAGAFILMGLVIIGALLYWYWPEPPESRSSNPPHCRSRRNRPTRAEKSAPPPSRVEKVERTTKAAPPPYLEREKIPSIRHLNSGAGWPARSPVNNHRACLPARWRCSGSPPGWPRFGSISATGAGTCRLFRTGPRCGGRVGHP